MDGLVRSARVIRESAPAGAREVVIGVLRSINETGIVRVDFPGNPAGEPISAISTTKLDAGSIGRKVALLFAGEELDRPVIVGLVRQSLSETTVEAVGGEGGDDQIQAKLDGERLVLSAAREIVLQCGSASITLTKAGKVLIRGKYLLSRSSGVNRIKGGSIQLN